MRDFLTDFYNKVINFFQAEKIEGENTKETAKSRLRLVLMQDRSNLEPETMAQLREELIEVISKYIVIDKESLGLNLDGDGESMALMLNIPVLRAKKPEEIQEALEEARAKQAARIKAEQEEKEEEIEEETTADEESMVEFSEGSIEELCECECNSDCECGCDGECSCEEVAKEEGEVIQEEQEAEQNTNTVETNNKKNK